MKKILLASSALVLCGGTAFAEVTLEGYAAMGLIGGDDYEGDGQFGGGEDDDSEYSFVSDLDVTFILSGETDGGVTFGAAIELDDAISSPQFQNEDEQGGESVFVSGDFGTISMGDTNGAFDFAISEFINVHNGTIGDVEEYGAYDGGFGIDPLDDGLDGIFGGQVARYDYAFANFAVAVSAELDDDRGSDPLLGIGATYNLAFAGGSVLLGAAYQGVDDATVGANIDDDSDEFDGFTFNSDATDTFDGDLAVYGVSAAMKLDMGLAFNAAITQTDIDGTLLTDGRDIDTDYTSYGIGVGYAFDAITVAASYGYIDYDSDFVANETESYALSAGYDLGGGLEMRAAYAQDISDSSDETEKYSFGVMMNF